MLTRFYISDDVPDQFQVWDRSIPDILAVYDNEPMAKDHVKRLTKAALKQQRSTS